MVPTRLYCVTNIINGKMYIGVTEKTVDYRWRKHRNSSDNNSPLKFHAAMRKYGADNFDVIELFEYPTDAYAKEAEVYLIAVLNTRRLGYNSSLGGDINPMKDAATRVKMSASKRNPSDEVRARISAAAQKRERNDPTLAIRRTAVRSARFTPERREKLSKALTGRKMPSMSNETKAKISAANKGKKRTPEQRAALSVAFTGRKYSDEYRKKMSERKKGRCYFSPEHRAALRAAAARRRADKLLTEALSVYS